jgi:hypothetical protein
MKATSKRSRNAKAELSGEAFEVINSLAAVLVLASVKASSAEKTLIGKEFTRVYGILSKCPATDLTRISAAEQKKVEKASEAIAGKLGKFVASAGVCCVGYPDEASQTACEGRSPAGCWACLRAPIDDQK